MTLAPPHIPPDIMTFRARLLMALTAVLGVGLGTSSLFFPQSYASTSFDAIREQVPAGLGLAVFGAAFLLAGVLAAYAAWWGRETPARIALMIGGPCTGAWWIGFVLAYFSGTLTAPSGLVVYFVLAGYQLVIGYDPMRTPLERLAVRRSHTARTRRSDWAAPEEPPNAA